MAEYIECKQILHNPYAVRTIVLSSGERLPMLIEKETGEPLFEPSIYVLSEIRATNKSSSTIEHVLRSIMVLQLFLDLNDIDIANRFREGRVLALHELDDLVRQCRLKIEEQVKAFVAAGSAQMRSGRVLRLGKKKSVPAEVKGHSAANRVRAIRDYLDWRVKYRMAAVRSTKEQAELWGAWSICKDALSARIPRHKGRNAIGQREGLSPEGLEKLFSVVLPDSPENPWKREATRLRNYVLIALYFELGLRRSELLNVKVSDINFQSGELTVFRRADDIEDPRKHQPNVKTRDRIIPLSKGLCELTYDYIMKIRRSYVAARKHPYLIVEIRAGAPLSGRAANDVFSDLREKFPAEFQSLTPHVLRHTWNDRFSEVVENKGLSEGDKEGMRSYLMGWSPTSKSSVSYTRQHNRKLAQKVSLEMQEMQVKGVRDDG